MVEPKTKRYRPRLTKRKVNLITKSLGHWLETGFSDIALRDEIKRLRKQMAKLSEPKAILV